MSDLTRRQMKAEAEANKHIGEKDYQHTASFARLTNAPQTQTSGTDLHQQLLKRAHVKEQMVTNNYTDSLLGTGGFRRSAFNEGDDDQRKKFLAKQAAHRRKHVDADNEAQIRKHQKTRTSNADVEPKQASPAQKRGKSAERVRESIRESVRPSHTFSEPTRKRYNPYS